MANYKKTHGDSLSNLYRRWQDMKQRCFNPHCCNYRHYGARGITVCPEWAGSNCFETFRDWALANGYKRELSLDRINNDGDYEPNNCRWVTKRVQNINKRPTFANTTGYVGIRRHCTRGGGHNGYYGSVKIGNKDYYTGYSKDLIEAVKMRNDYIIAHHLENQLNEVPECMS
jgi:hypothetical protein